MANDKFWLPANHFLTNEVRRQLTEHFKEGEKNAGQGPLTSNLQPF